MQTLRNGLPHSASNPARFSLDKNLNSLDLNRPLASVCERDSAPHDPFHSNHAHPLPPRPASVGPDRMLPSSPPALRKSLSSERQLSDMSNFTRGTLPSTALRRLSSDDDTGTVSSSIPLGTTPLFAHSQRGHAHAQSSSSSTGHMRAHSSGSSSSVIEKQLALSSSMAQGSSTGQQRAQSSSTEQQQQELHTLEAAAARLNASNSAPGALLPSGTLHASTSDVNLAAQGVAAEQCSGFQGRQRLSPRGGAWGPTRPSNAASLESRFALQLLRAAAGEESAGAWDEEEDEGTEGC